MARGHLKFGLAIAAALCVGAAHNYDPNNVSVGSSNLPAQLQGIGIDEHLGKKIDLGIPFVDSMGKPVTLAQYFTGKKPVILSIVYYSCPNICNFYLDGVTQALKQIKWRVGKEFELVTVSMNPRENPPLAAKKKAGYLKQYGHPATASGWHFLTGTDANIHALAKEVGWKYQWIADQKQYAHPTAAMILTPQGMISRYIYGINPKAPTLRLALIEASGGKIGSVVDQVVNQVALFCFHFDPHKSKYTLVAFNVMRIGGILMVIIMVIFLGPVWWRERRRRGNGLKE